MNEFIDRMTWSLGHHWTLILSVIVAIAPLPSALYKLGETLFSLRPHLKQDLEILRMLDPEDPNYKVVKAYIDRTIQEKYGKPSPLYVFNWQGIFGGLAGCVFMILWTVKLRAIGYRYWPWVTGLISFIFFSQFAASVREKTMNATRRRASAAPRPLKGAAQTATD